MNLYLVVLGGKINGGNVEMHDVRLVVGTSIESTLTQLKSEWIGKEKGLHIDSYKLIKFIDGYQIKLKIGGSTEKSGTNKLWLINLGGYKTGEMLEQHHIDVVVASSAQKAKSKALKKWSSQIKQVHKDDLFPIINIQNYSIELEPDPLHRNDGMQPDWSGYWLIN